jgi:hypothetical protein
MGNAADAPPLLRNLTGQHSSSMTAILQGFVLTTQFITDTNLKQTMISIAQPTRRQGLVGHMSKRPLHMPTTSPFIPPSLPMQ